MPQTATKVFSERARESALRVRRHQSALGASQQPDASGMTPAIAARVKEILAQQVGKGKKKGKAHAKPKANPKAKAAAAAAKKAEREKTAAAKKAEREKAKTERTAASTAKHEASQAARAKTKAEHVAAQQAKQAAAAKKKQSAIAKAKHAQKQAAAKKKQATHARDEKQQERTLIQSFQHATKAQDGYAIKQSAEERAMFASMGESGSLRPQNKQGKRTAPRKKATPKKQKVSQRVSKAIARLESQRKYILDAPHRARDPMHQATLRHIESQLATLHAGKAMTDLAIKTGARNARADKAHLDTAALHLHAAGATCPDCAPDEETDDGDATKAIKGIMDDPGYYAQHECGDIMQASSGLQTLAMLIQSELSEDDEDDTQIQKLCDAAETLITFMQGELDELRGAAKDDADGKTAGDVPMAKALDFFAVKSVGENDVVGPAIRFGNKNEPDLSKPRDFFTKSTDYWLDAWDKRPMLWHHTMPQIEIVQQMHDAGAGDDEIKAMRDAIVYLEQNPVIGVWTKATIDPIAVWMNGQLDTAHRYRAAIKRMIDLGMIKISTDSAEHLIRREKQNNGTHEVKRWPIIAASLTPSAAEPRLFDVQSIKSWYDVAGINLPFTIDDSPEAIDPESARRDGVKAGDERARRLLLELDILALETV